MLTGCGHSCVVVAPSLIPMKAGDRVKTDRRDAMMLAKLHRAGELTPIWIPDAAHEAMRDLVRARATAVRVLSKARQHLQGYLLHGITCSMSRSGNCWDNAAMEVFFSSLKTERPARKTYRTLDNAKTDVFDYIERLTIRSAGTQQSGI